MAKDLDKNDERRYKDLILDKRCSEFLDTFHQLLSCSSGVKSRFTHVYDSNGCLVSAYQCFSNGRAIDFFVDSGCHDGRMRVRRRNPAVSDKSLSDFYVAVPMNLVNDYQGMDKLLGKGLGLKR